MWSEITIFLAWNMFSSCQPKWYWQFLSDRMLPISTLRYFICRFLTFQTKLRGIFLANPFTLIFFFLSDVWLINLPERKEFIFRWVVLDIENWLLKIRFWHFLTSGHYWQPISMAHSVEKQFYIKIAILPKGCKYVHSNSKTNSNAISVMVHSLARSRCWYVRTQDRRNRGLWGDDPLPPTLADQLTLLQSGGGKLRPPNYLTHPDFRPFLRPWITYAWGEQMCFC